MPIWAIEKHDNRITPHVASRLYYWWDFHFRIELFSRLLLLLVFTRYPLYSRTVFVLSRHLYLFFRLYCIAAGQVFFITQPSKHNIREQNQYRRLARRVGRVRIFRYTLTFSSGVHSTPPPFKYFSTVVQLKSGAYRVDRTELRPLVNSNRLPHLSCSDKRSSSSASAMIILFFSTFFASSMADCLDR